MMTKEKARMLGIMTRQAADMLDEAARMEDVANRDTLVFLAMGQLSRVKAHEGVEA